MRCEGSRRRPGGLCSVLESSGGLLQGLGVQGRASAGEVH